jgi:hypothetical protein
MRGLLGVAKLGSVGGQQHRRGNPDSTRNPPKWPNNRLKSKGECASIYI